MRYTILQHDAAQRGMTYRDILSYSEGVCREAISQPTHGASCSFAGAFVRVWVGVGGVG